MFLLNKQIDYSLLIVSYLKGKRDFVPLSQLIRDLKLPGRYMARIASRLSKHGILKSKEGKSGGYKLVKDLEEISLFEIIKIFEKDISLFPCNQVGYLCRWENDCRHRYGFQNRILRPFLKNLAKLTIADIYAGD